MGYGDCSCFGSQTIRTPNIDRLASEGIRFTDFHSNGAVCSPTRAALMTGRYQQRCGIEGVITAAGHREVGLGADETTIANVLGAAGYKTAIYGKWHLGYAPDFNPTNRGFDYFRGFVAGNVDYFSHIDQVGHEDWWEADALVPEDGYTTDLVTAHGLRFIRENSDRPFFLYLAHECPHYPYQGPGDTGYRTPGNGEPIHGPREDREVAYVEMMESMDKGIGQIIDSVDDLGLAEDTLIFFFSDNGPAGPGSAGPLRGRKGTIWEGGHRVPAAARWSGVIPSRSETDATVLGMDLFPTFASAAGSQTPADRTLDGVDLMPLITDNGTIRERDTFWRHGTARAIRSGSMKLVVARDGEDPELYDVSTDLAEQNDISVENPDLVRDLARRLDSWETDVSRGVTRLA